MKTKNKEISFLERTGHILLLASIVGFAAAVVISFIPASITVSGGIAADGTIAAVSVIFLLVGCALAMPGLLRSNSQDAESFSTMRFMVFTVALVFSAIAIKIGWQTSSFEDFKVDSSWVYILGLAFGGKVAQTFTEKHNESAVSNEEEEEEEKAEEEKKK